MQDCSDTVSASKWHKNAGLLWLAREAPRAGLRLFMVGGSVRDYVLGRACADIDLVSAQDPTEIAKNLARTFKGHWFSLDATRNYSRVILPAPHAFQFDFSPFRAPNLSGDLALRDFTINAMAIDLAEIAALAETASRADAAEIADTNVSHAAPSPSVLPILDPLHGLKDLKRKRLHLCSAPVLQDDPLRIIKGLRHCATLGFSFSAATRSASIAAVQGLSQIAPERLRSEMAGIFSATNFAHLRYALTEFHTCGAAAALDFPVSTSTTLTARTFPELERAFTLLDLCSIKCSYIAARMQWSAGDEFTYRTFGLFAAWVRTSTAADQHDPTAVPNLKLSRKAQAWLQWFLTCPEDILPQLDRMNSQRYPRRAMQYLAHAGAPLPHGLAALVFFSRNSADLHTLAELWHATGTCLDKGRLRPLLAATLIQQYYPKLEGKALGSCLESLNTAERHGSISNSAEAWEWLKEYARKQNFKPESEER